jgi:hypothetical protein
VKGASRLDAIVATFVGILALAVSAYTAHIQRQQVRAQVLPILEFATGNVPELRVFIANKGVGPAIVKDVKITVDDTPERDWKSAMQRLLGPGQHNHFQSTINGRVIAAGESIEIFAPRLPGGAPLPYGEPNSEGDRFNQGRDRLGIEICYCSTLNDCWTLTDGNHRDPITTETARCSRSAASFRQ